MKFINKIIANKKSHFWLFFIVLVALSSLMLICYKPLCPGQDFHFHFRRFNALMEALKNGSSPIYLDYSALDGYGYLAKIFYSDFVLIPFAIIGNIANAVFGYKCMIFTMTVLCGIFTYMAVNSIYKNTLAASTSAILYTFCVYRLLDIYHRAALGEALSFTFVPLVFLGLYHIIKGDYKKWYIMAIGYSMMILTHLISSVLMLITIVIFLLIYYKPLIKEPKRIGYLILSGIIALILAGLYIFPMLEQMMSASFYYETKQVMARAQDAKMNFNWIFWGLFSGGVQPKQVFIPGIGILLTCAVCVRLFVHEKTKQLKSADILVILGLFYILAISSLFPWSVFPFNKLNFIQLPWRLYEFISFFFAVAGGYYISKALTSKKRILSGCTILIVATAFIMASDGTLYKETRCLGDINEEANIDNYYHLGGLEYVPSTIPSIEYIAERGSDSIKTEFAETSISNFKKQNGITSFDVNVYKTNTLELPLIYYKGYGASIDGKELSLKQSENGLVEIDVEQSGKVILYYKGTTIQIVSFYVSIISILALCIYVFLHRRKYRKEEYNK